jgi:hypothetical protein
MAKKKAVKATTPENNSVGHINLTLFPDGTYDLDTKISPAYLALYANVLLDMQEGKITTTIMQHFAGSDEQADQEIALFVSTFLKTIKSYNKPLISPDKVFRKNKRQ